MSDVFATITQASPAMLEQIATTLELRATLPHYQTILHAYLAEVSFPAQARVLEVGCGTGAVVRLLAGWPNVVKCAWRQSIGRSLSKSTGLEYPSPRRVLSGGRGESAAVSCGLV